MSWVSAVLKDQSLPALAMHVIEQRGILLKSAATEQQLFEVLARPYFVSLIAPAGHAWLKQLFATAEAVTIIERIAACRESGPSAFIAGSRNVRQARSLAQEKSHSRSTRVAKSVHRSRPSVC
jgi:hypothetical protein